MNLFNRSELRVIQDRSLLYRLQSALDAAGIAYSVRPRGRRGRSRGIPFTDPNYADTFYIYVNKAERERAAEALYKAGL